MQVNGVFLGERLKALRLEKGLSQGELAEMVGGDGRQISRYENGHITPSAEVLAKLAQALDCSVDYLLFEHAPRRPLTVEDGFANRLHDLKLLSEEDKASVLHILDALLAKNRIRSLAKDLEPPSAAAPAGS
jgi:transcriptional regulator with XRE-family HTH domain